MEQSKPRVSRPGGSGVLMSIQALRGIATFVVVLAHVQLYAAGKLHLPDLMPFYGVVGAAVDSFFVVSGFIMVYASERLFGRPGGTRTFFLRRLARILPMYWITTTIVLIYLLLQYGSLQAADASLSYVIASYLFIPTTRPDGWGTPLHGVAWTLNYEMFFYMLFGCFVFLSRRRVVVVLSVIFVALALVGLVFGPFPNPWAFWTYPLIIEFPLGMMLALLYRDGVRISQTLYWILLAVAAAVLFWSATQGHFFGPNARPRLIVWGIPAFFIVTALVLPRKPTLTSPFWRFWGFIGDASYSIYLIHPLTITIPRVLLAKYVAPADAPWLYVGLMIVLAFVPGIVAYIWFEKPLLDYFQRKIEGDRRATPIAATPPP
jgi:exopolysaccharide production protein ExoZ